MTTTAAIVSDGLGWILAAAGWFAYYRARRAHSAYRESSAGLTLRAVGLALRSRPDGGGSTPDDLRAEGWSVAVHNDYRLDGEPHTFWLVTRGEVALKGEGRTDLEALDEIRARARARDGGGPQG